MSWPSFAIARTAVPAFVAALADVVANGIGRPPRRILRVDGFEGRFEDLEEMLENVSDQDWAEAQDFSVRLVDTGGPNALQVVFAASREGGATLRIRGDRRVMRNGLLPDLQAVVQATIDAEKHRRGGRLRWARALKPLARSERPWLILSAVGALVTATAALVELHPLGL